jgi:hypothetical protein
VGEVLSLAVDKYNLFDAFRLAELRGLGLAPATQPTAGTILRLMPQCEAMDGQWMVQTGL